MVSAITSALRPLPDKVHARRRVYGRRSPAPSRARATLRALPRRGSAPLPPLLGVPARAHGEGGPKRNRKPRGASLASRGARGCGQVGAHCGAAAATPRRHRRHRPLAGSERSLPRGVGPGDTDSGQSPPALPAAPSRATEPQNHSTTAARHRRPRCAVPAPSPGRAGPRVTRRGRRG